MKKIPLSEINDLDEFWRGATFQKEGTGLNVDPEEDFCEYMLLYDPSNSEGMLCARVDKWERGFVICHVKVSQDSGRFTVTAKEFKRSMVLSEEIDRWYFIENEDGTRKKRSKAEV